VGRRDLESDAKLALADVLIFGGDDKSQAVIDAALESAASIYRDLGNEPGRLRAELRQLEILYQIGRMTPMLERGQALIDEALAADERAVAAQAMARLSAVAIWTGRTALAAEMVQRAETMALELGLLATARQARFYRAACTGSGANSTRPSPSCTSCRPKPRRQATGWSGWPAHACSPRRC
jgi:hypothetical protein